jgi:hypothetical protein
MIEEILQELNRCKVKYLVVGGIAVNLHGFYRSTQDLDIILLLENSNLKKFVNAVKKLKLIPRIPVKIEDFTNAELRKIWIKDKNMKAFTLYEPNFQKKYLDVIIDHPLSFRNAYKKRKIFKDGELNVPTIAITDLIAMKKIASRERDKIDINALMQIKETAHEAKKKI